MEIELERTFLAKYLPNDLDNFPLKQMQDNYIPKQARHPVLRIRKNGDKVCVTNVLADTEGVIAVVEGFTDTATALDLGLVGVGKPSAEGGNNREI